VIVTVSKKAILPNQVTKTTETNQPSLAIGNVLIVGQLLLHYLFNREILVISNALIVSKKAEVNFYFKLLKSALSLR